MGRYFTWYLYLLIYVTLFQLSVQNIYDDEEFLPEHRRCAAIEIPFCAHIGYAETIHPNLLNHSTQSGAYRELRAQFGSLIHSKCSPFLMEFLCYLYFPPCTVLGDVIPPCRSLCNRVMRSCRRILKKNHIEWPHRLQCDHFRQAQPCRDTRHAKSLRRNAVRPYPEDGYHIRLTHRFKNVSIATGDTAILHCSVINTSLSDGSIIWTKNKQSRFRSVRFKTVPNSQKLVIVNVQPGDDGIYRCSLPRSEGAIHLTVIR